MDLKQISEVLISFAGFALAVTYVIGGLIVNLHLSYYGIIQYQILKVKYLAVGLTYFTNFIATLFLSAVPAILLLTTSTLLQYSASLLSLVSSIVLLWLWGKPAKDKSFFFSWYFWVSVGTISSIFPIMIGLKLGLAIWLNISITYELGILIGLAFLTSVLSLVGQTYYYSRHLYGKRNVVFGSVDPIGMGIPVRVQLTGEKESISLLSHIGVPMTNPKTTEQVILIDETSTHYIIGIAKDEKTFQAIEVAKDIVKAVRYELDSI